MGDRRDAGLGGELVVGLEALAVVSKLGDDLGGVDLASAREGHHDLAGGELGDGVLDRGGEPADALDDGPEDADEVDDSLALGLLLERSCKARGCCAKTREKLLGATASGVAVARQEPSQALLTELRARVGVG